MAMHLRTNCDVQRRGSALFSLALTGGFFVSLGRQSKAMNLRTMLGTFTEKHADKGHIEELLYAHPKVADAAVVGKPRETQGEIPVAFISLKEGAEASKAEIIDYLKPKVAQYNLPREVVFVKEFRPTPTGKMLERQLREMPG